MRLKKYFLCAIIMLFATFALVACGGDEPDTPVEPGTPNTPVEPDKPDQPEQPKHEHTACPECGKCTDPECDGRSSEKCKGHTSVTPDPDKPVEPEKPTDSPEYIKYIDDLKEIVNVERGKIFERYGDFTDELENYLYYGEYPGREVTNKELTDKLSLIEETNEFGYIELEGLYFVKVVIENTYDSLEIGNTEFENSTKYKIGTTHFFLVEPILWRVLTYNPNTNQAFLVSNNIIEAKIFVDEVNNRFIDGRVIYPSNYEYSDIRKWCNDVFYNQAFNNDERKNIQLSTISNKFKTYNYEYNDDRDTEDYVFIPSFKELTTSVYGFENTGISSYSRFSSPSNYASAKGVYTSSLEDGIPDSGLYLIRGGAEFLKSYIYFVKFDGYALSPYYVNSPSTGVRLCVKVTIEN